MGHLPQTVTLQAPNSRGLGANHEAEIIEKHKMNYISASEFFFFYPSKAW